MLSIITVAASALALVGLAHGSDGPAFTAVPAADVPNELSDATWNLPIHPADDSSATVSFTGTVEKAVAKMEADYPGWNATFLAQDPISDDSGATETGNPVRHDCDVPGEEAAEALNIWLGIMYLRHVSGTAKNGREPLNCGRNCVEKELQWTQIANGAQYVLDQCGPGGAQWVKGLVEYDDNWSVIIHKGWC